MDMQVHQEFTKWAVNQGVVINDVSPFRFPEKGLGLVANKNFETGDILVQVPIKVLRKATDVPSQFAALAPDIAVHALFALSLDSLLGPEWIATLPSKQDMHSSMPLFWDISLQELLPYSSRALLMTQMENITSAWTAICKTFPEPPITYDEFIYNYSIVNSRTFYYLSPTIKPSKPQPSKENRLALNPFADYINHSSEPTVDATLSRAGYTLTASQPIKQGSEVHISYGSHNNDFLLVEYGFILEDNRWDEVTLDPWITPLLSVEQKEHLEETGFLGKYLLDRDTICYRTQVVLRILCLPIGRWRRFVQGSEDEEVSEEDAGKVLLKVLMAGKVEIVETIKKVEESQAGLEGQRETLSRRSNQIVLLLNRALHRIRC
ncbi:Bcrkm2 [Botrytis cinerea B05.10]|uniref:Bcrkm2 n=2 Tax=Botryotinia fuckeliana TaxID=40559 RepID=A0A384J4F8_BOTFB|nr:Bcrkm2 [Botrytis cinerea B05.10]ATZ45399.1 Bcrkm2 [Botrytis cinerea B05.10]EMR89863.1 putative set domain-containing protein [Botrytis cinerea BcDW1]